MVAIEARHFGDWWKSIDRTLLFVVLALISVGLILSLAASPAAAVRENFSDPFHFLYRHSFFAALSLIVLLAVSSLSRRNIRRLCALTLVGSLALIVATVLMGHEVGGASRWLRVAGFSLQPSEFLKPSLIVMSAWLFAETRNGAPIPGRVIAFGLYLSSVILLMMQPDFGQSILITLCFGGVFFVSGLNWRWMAGLATTATAGVISAWMFLPYVATRVESFLNPDSGDRYQTETAIAAISRGGLMGVGPGEGIIKRSLPDSHSDFIFAVAAEEFGLMASLAIIGLFSILVARAWMNALKLTDHFAQLAVTGLALQFGLQAVINIGVNLDIIPPKGMTLPFISYGGSSMLALAMGAGLMLALTRRRPGAYLRA
ncbi:putative lipid II flippase FtsW [Hyphobacterium sp. CCMP332]|jgi:cell division protein FtsW|uniref:putative lipid II flippase FtsW n=1 Tax=Hyphobacterium sp. CCMP332 TaxID=2749086 RepID=UPI0016503363|nr:putative lipid II flippase FtsW [Hyphobacterium sp. CCMP332]QNL18256.1 putative lipid II flippase FtsW [Hyphobacterium sp. CCMP332]